MISTDENQYSIIPKKFFKNLQFHKKLNMIFSLYSDFDE